MRILLKRLTPFVSLILQRLVQSRSTQSKRQRSSGLSDIRVLRLAAMPFHTISLSQEGGLGKPD
uniref:Uncharacterized protein n=1 Tax=Arundo donax TaxID=35708 RepID=A0A0A9HBG4_ARUDO